MEETLADAVRHGEKVLIVGHIPPGDPTTIMSYGDFYVPTVAKYRDVIVGQFFGHIHEDLFEVVGFATVCYIQSIESIDEQVSNMVVFPPGTAPGVNNGRDS